MSEDKRPYMSNRDRIKRDEEELKELQGTQEENLEEDAQEAVGGEQEEEDTSNLSKEEQTFKKRYGDLRSYMQKKEKEWEEKFEKLQGQLASVEQAPATEDEIRSWIEEHPQVSRIIQGLAEKIAKDQVSDVREEMDKLQKLRHETSKEKALNTIRKSHPDFDDISKDDDFHTWAEDQPKWIQDSIYENGEDPKAVIRVLDLYKADKGMTKKDAKAREKAAAGLVSKTQKASPDDSSNKKAFSESVVAKMSAKDYEKYEEAIVASMRDGTFVYDVSGGAR